MVTQEQKLQHVKEAAGECWHSLHHLGYFTLNEEQLSGMIICACGEWTPDRIYMNLEGEERINFARDRYFRNPSPDDLNELFRLAEKLFGTKSKVSFYPSTPCGLQCAAIYPTGLHSVGTDSGNNKAEALLNALFIATGGRK